MSSIHATLILNRLSASTFAHPRDSQRLRRNDTYSSFAVINMNCAGRQVTQNGKWKIIRINWFLFLEFLNNFPESSENQNERDVDQDVKLRQRGERKANAHFG